ncbi:dTDP-4-dehydrorhamnose 3,5-epimerase [Flavobacteriales bacterium]|nr:dTDP-4-dehydrorhamnose 3,5-epimerase [Flavobacteriales bacterium]
MAHPLEIERGDIEGPFMMRPRRFGDDRGYFSETWRQAHFEEALGRKVHFVQDNESVSGTNVLRGLHFQIPDHAQGKLVRVARGAALDVAVDLRKGSPTFGQHQKALLTEENRWQFWVPEGFAHGFLTLEPDTVFCYKCTEVYSPEHERSLLWNDADLAIDWGTGSPLLSAKDEVAPAFAAFQSPFD